ncbi:TRAP transporter small permease [Paracandidimonas soli]|uniref:TRAP transporter small permease protein n=1 Tax=Paracandidimonas soli TaxID=1917182 RepID=A0A4R3VCR7_9BURK|nr:TRAP transporter small permease [Paracandidimonas soli]TCV01424.1 TRAP-type C4-dicarboxylate transport system permease small subunit [Paracandidimonas soli]
MIPRVILKAIEWLLVILLGLMVVLVFGNVVLRYAFNSGLVFSEEVSRFIFMWLTLMGALLTMAYRSHLGMNSLIAAVPVPWRRLMRFTSDLIMLGCCLTMAWGTWVQVKLAMVDHAPVTGIPMGLVFSSLLICSLGMAWVLLHDLWRQVTGRMPASELVPNNGEVTE